MLAAPDYVSLANAAAGFAAIVVAADGRLHDAASLILIGGVLDGLDGVVAHRYGGGPLGVQIDSLSDAVTFGLAPGYLLFVAAGSAGPVRWLALAVPVATIVRLAGYNVRDVESNGFTGVPSTLAGTLIGAVFLASVTTVATGVDALAYVGLAVLVAYMMLTEVRYPELPPRYALVMGGFMVAAAVVQGHYFGVFPGFIAAWLLLYLAFGPYFYDAIAE
jgi:CDP-diacylglycerol--serine O-phosphatidyltransferase